MKHSKFNTDASHLTNISTRPSARRLEITLLSLTTPLPGPLSQQRRYETFHCTQTRGDDLLFMSMIDLLFSFFHSMVGSRKILYYDNFNILCEGTNWYCAKKVACFFIYSLSLFQNKRLRWTRSLGQEAVCLFPVCRGWAWIRRWHVSFYHTAGADLNQGCI